MTSASGSTARHAAWAADCAVKSLESDVLALKLDAETAFEPYKEAARGLGFSNPLYQELVPEGVRERLVDYWGAKELLTRLRSARSRQAKIAEEFDRLHIEARSRGLLGT